MHAERSVGVSLRATTFSKAERAYVERASRELHEALERESKPSAKGGAAK